MSRWLGKAAGLALLCGIAFGLFVLVVVPFEMYQKAQAESWPSRRAIVTQSFTIRQGGTGATRPYVKAEICGTYRDGGEAFCVRRVRYGGFRFGEGRASALETVAKYPVGSEIDVYYAPDDPKETLLEARSPWTEMYVLLGLALFFLALPVALWRFRRGER